MLLPSSEQEQQDKVKCGRYNNHM